VLELWTPRLRLVPLEPHLLALELEDERAMEVALGLETGHSELRGELRDAVTGMMECVRSHPDQWLWCTDWKIVLRSEGHVIGGFCFKGPPGETGEVEIGYGLYADHQRRGYMTEALQAALEWALAQPGVGAVLAETEKSNRASQRVLRRLGFRRSREAGRFLWWRADLASLAEPIQAAHGTSEAAEAGLAQLQQAPQR